MFKLQSGRTGPLAALLAVLGLGAGFALGNLAGLEVTHPLRLAIIAAVLVAASIATWRYWQDLDEAAKEAQKAAWYWGGSTGLGLGLLAIMYFVHADPTLLGHLPADASRSAVLQAGAFVVMVPQMAGFLLGWAIWWWRMR